VLLDHKMADGITDEEGTVVGNNPQLITDSAKLAAFRTLLGQFIDKFKANPNIKAWEVISEPYVIFDKGQASIAEIQNFIFQIASEIADKDPTADITLGAMTRETLVNYWTGLGLTMAQIHYFNPFENQGLTLDYPAADLGLDIPVFVGEVDPRQDADNNMTLEERLANIYANGYGKAYFWAGDGSVQFPKLTDAERAEVEAWLPFVKIETYHDSGRIATKEVKQEVSADEFNGKHVKYYTRDQDDRQDLVTGDWYGFDERIDNITDGWYYLITYNADGTVATKIKYDLETDAFIEQIVRALPRVEPKVMLAGVGSFFTSIWAMAAGLLMIFVNLFAGVIRGTSDVFRRFAVPGEKDIVIGVPAGVMDKAMIREIERLDPRLIIEEVEYRPDEPHLMLNQLEIVREEAKARASAMVDLTDVSSVEAVEFVMSLAATMRIGVFDAIYNDLNALDEAAIKKLHEMNRNELQKVGELLVAGLPVIENNRLVEKSIYELKIDARHETMFRRVTVTEKARAFAASGMVQIQPKYVSEIARSAADLRLLADTMKSMGLTKADASRYIQVRVLDPNITEENLEMVMRETGIGEYLFRDNIQLITGEDLSIERTLQLLQETFPAFDMAINPDSTVIGDIENLVKTDADERMMTADKAPTFLQMVGDGIISQRLLAIFEVIANDGVLPEDMGQIITKQGYASWLIFTPVQPVNYDELLEEMKRYEEVLIRA